MSARKCSGWLSGPNPTERAVARHMYAIGKINNLDTSLYGFIRDYTPEYVFIDYLNQGLITREGAMSFWGRERLSEIKHLLSKETIERLII